MSTPALMYEQALTPLKGWFEPSALDYAAKLSANVTIVLYSGRVAHLNASGELETGISGTTMPLFVFQNSTDFDVSNPGTTAKGNFVHRPIAPTGVINCLVATGAYELQSTEYDTGETYAPNQLLQAPTANTTQATGGVLTNQRPGGGGLVRQYTDAACGVVSRGTSKNEHEQDVIEFWPIYLPAAFS